MIAVDASAIAAFILKEPGWRRLARHLTYSVTVDLAAEEAANAIWKAYRLRGLVDREAALKLYRLLRRLLGVNVLPEPGERYLDTAFTVALDHGLTVYDALYVALALEKGLPLLTLDEKQARVAEKLGVRVVAP